MKKLTALVIAITCALTLGANHSSATTKSALTSHKTPVELIIYGDSIGREISPYVSYILAKSKGAKVLSRVYSGTSPCQWIKTAQSDSLTYTPRNVVILFVGNLFADCMNSVENDPTGVSGMRKTVRDASRIGSLFAQSEVFFVGFARRDTAQAQIDAGRFESADDYRNRQLRELSRTEVNYHYIDGATPLYSGGRFTRYLPCRAFDAGHCFLGMVQVRADDGMHLCPNSTYDYLIFKASCPEHNSGTIRLTRRVLQTIS
jgi:hypothetical protein